MSKEAAAIPINLLVEGYTDEIITRRILEHVGLACGTVYGKNGKGTLLKSLPRYNQAAAHFGHWLTIIDLDHDAPCAPGWFQNYLPYPTSGMHIRIAVRAIEAWLLADAERLADFLHISPSYVPSAPDDEENPKVTLINLAWRSRKKAIREDMTPRPASGSQVGPGYASQLTEFITKAEKPWRPEIAMQRSDSLMRCIRALQTWKQEM